MLDDGTNARTGFGFVVVQRTLHVRDIASRNSFSIRSPPYNHIDHPIQVTYKAIKLIAEYGCAGQRHAKINYPQFPYERN